MKIIGTQKNNGLEAQVIWVNPSSFLVKFKNKQFNFDNSYNAFLKARELVGQDLNGYKYK
jgi:hypothetical protein